MANKTFVRGLLETGNKDQSDAETLGAFANAGKGLLEVMVSRTDRTEPGRRHR